MTGMMDTVVGLVFGVLQALGLAGGAAVSPLAHGYVEGEYLRIAAPAAGRLERLEVTRGQSVAAGAPLFAIDRATAQAERDRLAAALAQARAQRADLTTGKRAEEMAVLAAQQLQAEAALRLSAAELERQTALAARKVSSEDKLDSARAAFERDQGRLAETRAQMVVGGLGARAEQMRAAELAVVQAQAALAQADQRLADLAPNAPTGARVEDTLFNVGEWVPAGAPVVTLLPPQRVKLVLFVPETQIARTPPGTRLRVRCDSCPADVAARVTHVATQAEYTPPVIYSVGSREKLVFRVEAAPDVALPPGLPVDVEALP